MSMFNLQNLLPAWVDDFLQTEAARFPDVEARMAFVIRLARHNVENGSGGPFGAAVFERDSGLLVAVGVNAVITSRCSHAHAEMVALALAQQQLGTHDLASPGLPPHQLVTSCEPCAMCLGAIPWSGVKHVVCGALDEDARAIGFDEGAKPANWQAELEARGIKVQTGVHRAEAVAVLQRYVAANGMIYNAHSD
ncbi:MAG: nucleoside deaminase [Gammaproteobacteria bacterium]|nr:nucleoside deaminase [Gammaproteobacteria bacterium]MBU1722584.1 nucleoside deaminase [Gammaproteobacteria bacterium]MBU2007056.1 nucleoside deaminase [Gammaproteobacteria bacterium]